jgi:hypothetical protein
MHVVMPEGADMLTVEFAVSGGEPGATARASVPAATGRICDIITAARRAIGGSKVGNLLSITCGQVLLFTWEDMR